MTYFPATPATLPFDVRNFSASDVRKYAKSYELHITRKQLSAIAYFLTYFDKISLEFPVSEIAQCVDFESTYYMNNKCHCVVVIDIFQKAIVFNSDGLMFSDGKRYFICDQTKNFLYESIR